jgi:putative flippase GtrA
MTTARNFLDRRFARFLLTGGIAAAVNVVSRYFLSMAMEYRWAVIAAYLCGMTTAWILSRLFVFEGSGRSRAEEYMRFGIVNVVAAAQVWAVSVFTSYLGHKHFSFAPLKPKS